MHPPYQLALLPFVLILSLTTGCATAPPDEAETAFENFLVLSIADNYTNRAQYERTVVSLLKSKGASATAYYQAVGGNKPVDRGSVREVLAANSYDAVLVTRVLDTASEADIKSGTSCCQSYASRRSSA